MSNVNISASTSSNDEGKIKIYSKSTFKFTTYNPKFTSEVEGKKLERDLEKEITESIKSSPELRKEIRRVFDIANKRIARLNQTDSFDVLSPAIQTINRGKFLVSQSNGDWNTLVGMYKEAVAFIRQPTSTVKGAREFTQHVKDKFMDIASSKYNKSEEQLEYLWTASIGNIQSAFSGLSAFTDKIKYQQVVQEIYDEAIDTVSNAIERDALILQQELEKDIDDTSKDLAHEIVVTAQKDIDEALENFFKDWN